MQLTYLDFELEIGTEEGRDYPVIARSPAGEARATMRFPFDDLALQSKLKDLQIALLRSGGKRRQVLLPEQQAVRDFGQALFDALFSGEVRNRYDVSLQQARSQGKGLRIRLQAQSPTAAALPWEYLYDPRQSEHCSLSVETPLVRYLELPQPITPLIVAPPLRMLGMVASPANLPPLDIAQEKQRIEQSIQGLQDTGRLELEWLPGQTWRDLQGALRRGPWHIFHFSGHGRFDTLTDEGQLIFADDQGRPHVLPASDLGRLLANHRTLRLTWLNACEGARGGELDIFSSSASILVRRGIPAVVAMQYEITDRAAIELARTFYEAVADGYPVDAALAEARVGVSLAVNNTVEWGTPALFMRAPDGVLFDLADPARVRQTRIESPVPAEKATPPAPSPIRSVAQEATPTRAPAQPTVRTGAALQKPRQRSLRRVLPIAALTVVAIGVIVLLANWAGLFPDTSQVRATETAVAQATTFPAAFPGLNTTATPTPMVTANAVASTATPRPPTPTRVPPTATLGLPISTRVPPTATLGLPISTRVPPTATPRQPTPTALANKVVITDTGVRITEPIEMELVRVPGGEFLMGGDPSKDADPYSNPLPQHPVTLTEFYIGKTEVTNDQYAAFVEATGHDAPDDWENGKVSAGKGDHPVAWVSPYDAVAFTEWLSQETGVAFRLPTEAEWEKAASWDAAKQEKHTYPWGDEFDATKCNTFESGIGGTTPVGAYSPAGDSPYGVADLCGNVWEWVADWWAEDYYQTSPVNNPQGPETGQHRVLRGGSWHDSGSSAAAPVRHFFRPGYRSLGFSGFRVCAVLPPP